nr:carbohydrate sulfotransferase 1-like [Procambarus clarkii]
MEPLRRHAAEGSSLLSDILRCRFSQRMNYFREWVTGPQANDLRVKAICEVYPSLCEDPAYTEAVCRAACANVVKVATAELGVATPLLQDPSLQVKVIHLVRDPRALLASRYEVELGKIISKVDGTFFTPEDKNATTVCRRYRQDLAAARSLRRQYPHRYMLVRYEDLALDPLRQVRALYAFVDLPYTVRVAHAVAKHTLGLFVYYYQVDPYSTFKNSTATVFEWRTRLAFEEVERVQEECADILQAYGYHSYHSRLQYDDPRTSPLLSLTPEMWSPETTSSSSD